MAGAYGGQKTCLSTARSLAHLERDRRRQGLNASARAIEAAEEGEMRQAVDVEDSQLKAQPTGSPEQLTSGSGWCDGLSELL